MLMCPICAVCRQVFLVCAVCAADAAVLHLLWDAGGGAVSQPASLLSGVHHVLCHLEPLLRLPCHPAPDAGVCPLHIPLLAPPLFPVGSFYVTPADRSHYDQG